MNNELLDTLHEIAGDARRAMSEPPPAPVVRCLECGTVLAPPFNYCPVCDYALPPIVESPAVRP